LAIVQARADRFDDAVASLETALGRYRDELTEQELQFAEATLRQIRFSG
jgi:hypothetical protein